MKTKAQEIKKEQEVIEVIWKNNYTEERLWATVTDER
jgi:protease II